MRKLRWALIALGAVLAGCQEKLATPGDCPALCPDTQIQVLDTAIVALPDQDSTFFGYTPRASRGALLVSNGLAAGEFRSFVRFPSQRSDSILVDGTYYALAVDTVSVSFTLRARDSTATGLTVYLHRVPLTVDTTLDFAGLDGLLTPGSIVDSIQVPDTLHTGVIEALFTGSDIDKLAVPPEDSGKIAFGLTVRASKPTGVQLALDFTGSTAAPQYQSRGSIDIADTTKTRQTTAVHPASADAAGYVLNDDRSVAPDPDLLYSGGPGAARTIVRFALPNIIKDTAQILRATLELTPAAPLAGLPNNPLGDSLGVSGVIADLGAKSPRLVTQGLVLFGALAESSADTVSIDITRLVAQWQSPTGPPSAIILGQNSEGQSFMQPVFYSTRSAAGAPRLIIVYALPSRPGNP